jgi:hypothetical protein
MKKLLFTALTGLMFLSTSSVNASVSTPNMNCVINVYDSCGEYVGTVAVFNVSCCGCASTREKAVIAINS